MPALNRPRIQPWHTTRTHECSSPAACPPVKAAPTPGTAATPIPVAAAAVLVANPSPVGTAVVATATAIAAPAAAAAPATEAATTAAAKAGAVEASARDKAHNQTGCRKRGRQSGLLHRAAALPERGWGRALSAHNSAAPMRCISQRHAAIDDAGNAAGQRAGRVIVIAAGWDKDLRWDAGANVLSSNS